MLPLYQRHWNSLEYQLLREKGKKVRASSKGGSLHTAGSRSTLAVKEKLKKEKGRELPTDEIFEETHLKKRKNPTDEDVWVELCVKAVHDGFRRFVSEYLVVSLLKVRVTQYPSMYKMSYGQKLQILQIEAISMDATQFFGDNIRCSSGPAYSSSSVDIETIVRL